MDSNIDYYDKQIEKQKNKINKARKDFADERKANETARTEPEAAIGSGSVDRVDEETDANERLNKELVDLYITEKKLESLRVRAAGDGSAADALDLLIEKYEEAVRVAREYGITLEEAVTLVAALNEVTAKVPDDGGDLERQKKLMEMKLAALKAETRGEDALAEALRNRIKLAERILEIMNETGATQREATIIANKQIKAELTGGGGSTGSGSTESGNIVRGNITTGRIKSVGSGTRESRFGRMPTMDERERAAGLNLRSNDTMSGRAATGASALSLGSKGDKDGQDGESSTPEWQTAIITIKETVTKLDNALGSN